MKFSVHKTVVAVVLAVAQSLAVILPDGSVEGTEVVNLVLAVLTALGVYVIPNKVEVSGQTTVGQ